MSQGAFLPAVSNRTHCQTSSRVVWVGVVCGESLSRGKGRGMTCLGTSGTPLAIRPQSTGFAPRCPREYEVAVQGTEKVIHYRLRG